MMARHVSFPTARSHPSKISPRWQPYRITAAVASSAFAKSSHHSDLTAHLALDNSGPTCASRVRRPTPACWMIVAPLISEAHSTMDRRPSGWLPLPALIFPDRTLHTFRFESPARFFADDLRAPFSCPAFARLIPTLSCVSRLEVSPHNPRAGLKKVLLSPFAIEVAPSSSVTQARTMVDAVCRKRLTARLPQDLPHRAIDCSMAPLRSHPCGSPGDSLRKRCARCCLTEDLRGVASMPPGQALLLGPARSVRRHHASPTRSLQE